MKRGGELKRSTPMARTGFSSRGSALERQAPIAPRRTKPRTVELSDGIGEGVARERVKARSGGWCEMQVPGFCYGRATNWCHRVGKGQGGLWQASNGLDGCGSGTTGCHGWCHSNPAAARELGWMLLSTEDPATVRTLIHTVSYGHTWVLLGDDGSVTLASFPASAPGHPDDLPVAGVA